MPPGTVLTHPWPARKGTCKEPRIVGRDKRKSQSAWGPMSRVPEHVKEEEKQGLARQLGVLGCLGKTANQGVRRQVPHCAHPHSNVTPRLFFVTVCCAAHDRGGRAVHGRRRVCSGGKALETTDSRLISVLFLSVAVNLPHGPASQVDLPLRILQVALSSGAGHGVLD